MTKTKYLHYTIKAEYTGSKKAEWGNDKNTLENWNHHNITVKNNKTGKQAKFDFWASIVKPGIKKESDLLDALYCWVNDAVSGLQSFEEFCYSLGLNTDSRFAESTWKHCRKATKQAQRVIDGDLYEFYNKLSEVAG